MLFYHVDPENLVPLYDYMYDRQNITAAFSPYGMIPSFASTALTELARLNVPTFVPSTSQLYGQFPNMVGTLIPNKRIQRTCAAAL